MARPTGFSLLAPLLLCGATTQAGAAELIPPGFPDVVLFAERTLQVKNDTRVVSGNLVANSASPGGGTAELSVGPKAKVLAGSLSGDSVRVKSQTLVQGDVHYNDLVNQGTITGALFSPQSLPVFSPLPAFKTGTPGPADVIVANSQTLTLPSGAYAHLEVGHGATVYFTGGVYSFASIQAQPAAALLFDAAADVLVAGVVAVGTGSVVGPSSGKPDEAAGIVFYVAGADGAAATRSAKSVVLGVRSRVAANVYAPSGTLDLQQGCVATGAFLGKDVEVGPHATLTLASAFFNHPPLAAGESATVAAGGTVTVLNGGATSLLANDGDPDGDALVVTTTPVSGPLHGTLVLNADGTFAYTHDGSDASSDSFVYEACDQGFPVLCDTATVTISIEPPPFNLAIERAGTGSGRVTSAPAGIDCGTNCSAAFPAFLDVTLSAQPDRGSVFTGWSGPAGCASGVVSGPPDLTCTATFDTGASFTLTVQKDGTGTGHVSSVPGGIDCGPVCAAALPAGIRVELSALADPGSAFAGFGGDPDCEDGELLLSAATTCTATFVLLPPPPTSSTLTVLRQGAGTGVFTSTPPGIDCDYICEAVFADGTEVTLLASPDPGFVFVGWGADCAGAAPTTAVTMGPDKICTGSFAPE